MTDITPRPSGKHVEKSELKHGPTSIVLEAEAEDLFPGQTWDDSKTPSSFSSGSLSSGSLSSPSSPFNEDESSSSGSFDDESSLSSLGSSESSGSSPARGSESSGSSDHPMRHMHMQNMHMHKKKLPAGQTEDSPPPPEAKHEGFLDGFIKNIVRDLELDVFLMVAQSGGKEYNLLVTNKTLVLEGNQAGDINQLAPNRTILFQIGPNATVNEIRITGGTARGHVVELTDSLLVIQGEPKKKIISTD